MITTTGRSTKIDRPHRVVGLFVVRQRAAVRTLAALLLCSAAGAIQPGMAAGSAAPVDSVRIGEADKDAANWLTYGRTYSEQRFSPLSKITVENAKDLGLAWSADLDTDRGQEATPLVIDGVLYVSTAWSMVKAYNDACPRWARPGSHRGAHRVPRLQ